MAETNTMDVIFVDYLLPGETKKQTVPLKEFLTLPQDQLTEQNQKVQKALGQLYKLNDREPPLYHSFPKRNVGPLVIDCTPVMNENFSACYYFKENKVKLEESTLEGTELDLLDSFSHELKHAEQFSEEFCAVRAELRDKDGLGFHQLLYLTEAQAYAFDEYVKDLFYAKEKGVEDKNIKTFSDVESAGMKDFLQILYEKGHYKSNYDLISPITRKDKGLTVEDIPVSFHFRDNQEALSLLEDMPRYAHTWEGRRRQLQKEHHEVFITINSGYTEGLEYFVDKGLKSGEMPPHELLIMVNMEFTNKQPSAEHIRASREMLNYFLDLEVGGKLLMQEGDISDLLKGARASGRKDVEEAIQEYQKEHPDDERFPEKMFNPNPKDKVAEYEKRKAKEAEATKIKAVAGKKPVPALAAAKTAKGR